MHSSLCQERNVAVQTIKAITRGPWATKERTLACWYEPLEDQDDIDRAVHWVMGRPGTFLNTVGDIDLLPRMLEAAGRFTVGVANDVMGAFVAERRMTPLFV